MLKGPIAVRFEQVFPSGRTWTRRSSRCSSSRTASGARRSTRPRVSRCGGDRHRR
ncbi:hypothetical protein ACFQZ4_53415 [Catellatospora coxensis]